MLMLHLSQAAPKQHLPPIHCWYNPMTLLFSEVHLCVSVCACVSVYTPLSVHMYMKAREHPQVSLSGMLFTSSETGSLIVLELMN